MHGNIFTQKPFLSRHDYGFILVLTPGKQNKIPGIGDPESSAGHARVVFLFIGRSIVEIRQHSHIMQCFVDPMLGGLFDFNILEGNFVEFVC